MFIEVFMNFHGSAKTGARLKIIPKCQKGAYECALIGCSKIMNFFLSFFITAHKTHAQKYILKYFVNLSGMKVL